MRRGGAQLIAIALFNLRRLIVCFHSSEQEFCSLLQLLLAPKGNLAIKPGMKSQWGSRTERERQRKKVFFFPILSSQCRFGFPRQEINSWRRRRRLRSRQRQKQRWKSVFSTQSFSLFFSAKFNLGMRPRNHWAKKKTGNLQ